MCVCGGGGGGGGGRWKFGCAFYKLHSQRKKKREVLRTSFAWRRDAPQEAKAEAELRLKRSFSEYMVMVINHQNKVQGKG